MRFARLAQADFPLQLSPLFVSLKIRGLLLRQNRLQLLGLSPIFHECAGESQFVALEASADSNASAP